MRGNNLRCSLLCAATLLALASPSAFAGTLTGGATFPEQIAQEVTLLQSKVEGAERLVQQIQMYENMVQNMVNLPQTMIDQIMQPINQLYGMVGQAEALGTNAQNIANQFQNLNPSFNPQMTMEYTQHYQSITSGLSNAINTALQAANLNPNAFTQQATAQQEMEQALQNPSSRNALLQGAVAAGQATVSALTQMQQTANAEATAQMTYLKAKTLQEAAGTQADESVANSFVPKSYTPAPSLSGNPMDDLNP